MQNDAGAPRERARPGISVDNFKAPVRPASRGRAGVFQFEKENHQNFGSVCDLGRRLSYHNRKLRAPQRAACNRPIHR